MKFERKQTGYRWWQWALAVVAFIPLFPMLIAEIIPNTRPVLTAKRIWAGYALFLLVGFVLLVVVAALSGAPDEGAGATVTAPTAAPVVPTPTEQPTAMSTDCPSESEMEYFEALGEEFAVMAETSPEIGSLFQEAAADISVVLSTRWRGEMAIRLHTLESSANRILELSPPESAAKVSTPANAIAQLTIQAVDRYTDGVDNLDPAATREGNQLIRLSGEQTDKATQAITTFCK